MTSKEEDYLISLIERDTPKKVVFNTIHFNSFNTIHYIDVYECPICNDIVETEVNHCGNCGQRLAWRNRK